MPLLGNTESPHLRAFLCEFYPNDIQGKRPDHLADRSRQYSGGFSGQAKTAKERAEQQLINTERDSITAEKQVVAEQYRYLYKAF